MLRHVYGMKVAVAQARICEAVATSSFAYSPNLYLDYGDTVGEVNWGMLASPVLELGAFFARMHLAQLSLQILDLRLGGILFRGILFHPPLMASQGVRQRPASRLLHNLKRFIYVLERKCGQPEVLDVDVAHCAEERRLDRRIRSIHQHAFHEVFGLAKNLIRLSGVVSRLL